MNKVKSDGTSASYYELPAGCAQLQDLISHRNLNTQDGEMFRAIYRKGMASHSDELRDARKVLFYAQAEVDRLVKLQAENAGWTDTTIKAAAFKSVMPDAVTGNWAASADERIDIIGQNGGEPHYADLEIIQGGIVTKAPGDVFIQTEDGETARFSAAGYAASKE